MWYAASWPPRSHLISLLIGGWLAGVVGGGGVGVAVGAGVGVAVGRAWASP